MNTNKRLKEETCSLIKEIYRRNPAGGPLHIVLDDGNVESECIQWCLCNSIRQVKDEPERMLYVKCACNLLEMGGDIARMNCIREAFARIRGISNKG